MQTCGRKHRWQFRLVSVLKIRLLRQEVCGFLHGTSPLGPSRILGLVPTKAPEEIFSQRCMAREQVYTVSSMMDPGYWLYSVYEYSILNDAVSYSRLCILYMCCPVTFLFEELYVDIGIPTHENCRWPKGVVTFVWMAGHFSACEKSVVV